MKGYRIRIFIYQALIVIPLALAVLHFYVAYKNPNLNGVHTFLKVITLDIP